ncbi:MAG: hypothetical protein M1548_06570 [Actinobacteria bacterium]|nr:hypothetical protein [Actinomycetota bacterium]
MKAIRKEPAPEPKQLGKIVKSTSAAGLALIFPLIYTGYWAYRVNKEIAEHDSSIDVDPVICPDLLFQLEACLSFQR